jgi:MFS family permease
MQGIAVAWVVLEMTGSKFWLGVINGVPTISIVLFSLIGGVIADSREARRVLLVTRVALAVTAVMTALLVGSGHVQLSHLLVYVLLIVGIAAIDMPVSRTLMHEVVGSTRLLAAGAAQSVFMNMVNIAAPLGIGVLIGVAGSSAAFWVLGAGYSVAALLVLNGSPTSKAREARSSNPFADVAAGLSYIRRTPAVAALVGLGFLVPVAGVYFAMVPVIARETLNTGPGGLGVLVASFSVGSLLGSVYLAVNGAMRRRGLSLTLLGVVFGCGMMGFALSKSIELSCAISFVMGVTAGFWQNMLSAMVQLVAAPEMRGRVVSVFTMAFQLMGIGWLAAGTLATAFGNEATLIAAGTAFSVLSVAVYAVSKETREID